MSPIWIVPALVAVVGAVAVGALLRSLAEDARLLAREVGALGDLRPAVARLHADSSRLAAGLRRSTHRR